MTATDDAEANTWPCRNAEAGFLRFLAKRGIPTPVSGDALATKGHRPSFRRIEEN